MKVHISYAPVDECINYDSYGCSCVRCNKCGRLDENSEESTVSEETLDDEDVEI